MEVNLGWRVMTMSSLIQRLCTQNLLCFCKFGVVNKYPFKGTPVSSYKVLFNHFMVLVHGILRTYWTSSPTESLDEHGSEHI